MSSVPGLTERAIAYLLTSECLTMHDLAEEITCSLSRAAVESVRRACRRMVERGTVELDYRDTVYPTSYPDRKPDPHLWSEIGDVRNAYEPGHLPAAPCCALLALKL